jgi:hypothetical protein
MEASAIKAQISHYAEQPVGMIKEISDMFNGYRAKPGNLGIAAIMFAGSFETVNIGFRKIECLYYRHSADLIDLTDRLYSILK